MAKIAASAIGAFVTLIATIAAAVSGVVAVLGAGNSAVNSQPSPAALADIPGNYLTLYQQAAPTCPGLDWSILAAIGKIETDHGRLDAEGVHSGENFAHAGGPMQFLQPTFNSVIAEHPPPPGGSAPPSRYNPHDAIYAAAAYLCDSGARDGRDLHHAIFTYNNADWYVRKVVDQADAYKTVERSTGQQSGWNVPSNGRCTSGFGYRGGELHRGQDIAAPIGSPIVAAADGTVIDAGPATGYGLWIRIRHTNDVVSTYGHNHRNLVQAGQQIHAGQQVAEVGNRGESTGPHLHFQVELGGQAVDPVTFYRQQSAPSLCTQ